MTSKSPIINILRIKFKIKTQRSLRHDSHPVICEGRNCTRMRETLVWRFGTSLNPPLFFIDVPVKNQENEWKCVLGSIHVSGCFCFSFSFSNSPVEEFLPEEKVPGQR